MVLEYDDRFCRRNYHISCAPRSQVAATAYAASVFVLLRCLLAAPVANCCSALVVALSANNDAAADVVTGLRKMTLMTMTIIPTAAAGVLRPPPTTTIDAATGADGLCREANIAQQTTSAPVQ